MWVTYRLPPIGLWHLILEQHALPNLRQQRSSPRRLPQQLFKLDLLPPFDGSFEFAEAVEEEGGVYKYIADLAHEVQEKHIVLLGFVGPVFEDLKVVHLGACEDY